MTKPEMSVTEALEVAIAFMDTRDRSENKREAAAVLRRLASFLEAAMEAEQRQHDWENDRTDENLATSLRAANMRRAAYRKMVNPDE